VAAWPLAARAQEAGNRARYLTAFRQGLREPGYLEPRYRPEISWSVPTYQLEWVELG
jgi:hypothetical protein